MNNWQYERFLNGFEELESVSKSSRRNLANQIGVSPSKISRWLSKDSKNVQRQPTLDDAVRIGRVSSAIFNKSLFDECKRWILLAGHQLEDKILEQRLFNESDLERRVDLAFEDLSLVAEQNGLPKEATRTALSAFFGQQYLKHKIEVWLKHSQGQGQIAFFWEWRDAEPIERLAKHVQPTKEFLAGLLNPSESMRSGWDPSMRSKPQIEVFGFFVNSNASAIRKFQETRLIYQDIFETKRIHFFVQQEETKPPFEHLADMWFFSSPKTKDFGMLASETPEEFKNLLTAQDVRLKRNPWKWASQLAPAKGHSIHLYLKNRRINLASDNRFKPDREFWTEVNMLGTTD